MDERKAVADVLEKANLNINAIDVKPAANDSSKKEIINGIKESDFIILIVGERYGSIIPEMTGSRTLSITRWEYIKAVRRFRKDVLVYFKSEFSDDPINYDNRQSSDFNIKRKLLAEFKNKLSSKHSPKYFSNPKQLAEEVKKALIPTYRAGVKALINKYDRLLTENQALNEEVRKLRESIHKPQNSSINETARTLGLAAPRYIANSPNAFGLARPFNYSKPNNR
jgi:regulator of replication initiation timing